MYGCLSSSDNVFQRLPRRFEISALCISGWISQILRLSIWDHTMNAFIGLLMWFGLFFLVCAHTQRIKKRINNQILHNEWTPMIQLWFIYHAVTLMKHFPLRANLILVINTPIAHEISNFHLDTSNLVPQNTKESNRNNNQKVGT